MYDIEIGSITCPQYFLCSSFTQRANHTAYSQNISGRWVFFFFSLNEVIAELQKPPPPNGIVGAGRHGAITSAFKKSTVGRKQRNPLFSHSSCFVRPIRKHSATRRAACVSPPPPSRSYAGVNSLIALRRQLGGATPRHLDALGRPPRPGRPKTRKMKNKIQKYRPTLSGPMRHSAPESC